MFTFWNAKFATTKLKIFNTFLVCYILINEYKVEIQWFNVQKLKIVSIFGNVNRAGRPLCTWAQPTGRFKSNSKLRGKAPLKIVDIVVGYFAIVFVILSANDVWSITSSVTSPQNSQIPLYFFSWSIQICIISCSFLCN